MYIIKNALRCIGRAKGRNVLIGIIALVIAIAACIGLSMAKSIVEKHGGEITAYKKDGTHIGFKITL